VSTVGVVPRIRALAAELPGVSLALSLHAPNQALRARIVPSARAYPLERLMAAVAEYQAASGQRVRARAPAYGCGMPPACGLLRPVRPSCACGTRRAARLGSCKEDVGLAACLRACPAGYEAAPPSGPSMPARPAGRSLWSM